MLNLAHVLTPQNLHCEFTCKYLVAVFTELFYVTVTVTYLLMQYSQEFFSKKESKVLPYFSFFEKNSCEYCIKRYVTVNVT